MPRRPTAHDDLGGYVLGRLEQAERERFEKHLSRCARCREELGELEPLAELLSRAAPAFAVPSRLQAKALLAVERAAAEERAATAMSLEPEPARWTWPRALGALAVSAAVLAAGIFIGTQLDRLWP